MKPLIKTLLIPVVLALGGCNAANPAHQWMPIMPMPMMGMAMMMDGMDGGRMKASPPQHADNHHTATRTGEQVFKAACASCHTTGMLGAPVIGDKTAWASRIAAGMPALVKSATNGVRAMPARGGNPALTDKEVAAAVAYMTSNL